MMTNEEAIRVLNVAKAECEWNAPLEYQEAFDAAIKALIEQSKHDQNSMSKQPDLETLGVKTGETCADVISRQDAIEELSYLQTYLFDSRDHDNKVSLEDVRYAIEQLPSAQPEQRWIPWDSERLPDDSGTYIVTAYDGAKERVTFAMYQKRLKRWGLAGARAYWRVLAWMPLPEPYRAKRRADE